MSGNNEMFEKASRLKLRFESAKGHLTTEDLWDLPLTSGTGKANLDDIAKALHRDLKESDEISFVTPASTTNVVVQLKFEIVKHVIDVRIIERDQAAEAASRAEKKQKILSLIAHKQDEAMAGSSLEELQKLADSL